MRRLALLAALTAWGAAAQAPLATYAFEGTPAPSAASPQVVALDAALGAGLSAPAYVAGNPGQALNTSGYGPSFDPDDVLEVTVSAASGFELDLSGLAVDLRRSNSGPPTVELRTSADGFAAPVETFAAGTSFATFAADLSGAAFQNLATLTVRLYGYGATGSAGTLRFDNLTLSGTAAGTGGGVESASVAFSAPSATVVEGGTAPLSLVLAIVNEQGGDGLDAPLSGTLVVTDGPAGDVVFTAPFAFPVGAPTGSLVSRPVLAQDDAVFSGDRTVTLGFDAVTGGTASGTFALTIQEDDAPPPVSSDVRIHELHADTPAPNDAGEFVELRHTGGASASLDGLALVFFNGATDAAYQAYDLDGRATGGDGLFVFCTNAADFPAGICDLDTGATPTGGLLQNGADAVALYVGDAADFPFGTPATAAGLVDAVVYGSSDARDAGLLAALGRTVQFDEDLEGDDTQSLGRLDLPAGERTDLYYAVAPSPGAANPATLTVDATASVADAPGFRLLGAPLLDAALAPFDVDDLAGINLVQGVPAGAVNGPQYALGAPNLFGAYSGSDVFVPVPDTDAPAPPGRGFVWYWYDLDLTPPPNDPSIGPGTSVSYDLANPAFALALTGVPVDDAVAGGAVVVAAPQQTADGFYLFANPFAYPVRLGGVTASTGVLSTAFSAWDPAAAGGAGSYVTLTADPADPFAGDALPVWNAAFAEVSGAAGPPALQVSSAAADPGAPDAFVGRPAEGRLAFALTGVLSDGTPVADLAASVRFAADASEGWDRHDGSKLEAVVGARALLALVGERDGAPLRQAVLSRPASPGAAARIPVAFTASQDGSFRLTWEASGAPVQAHLRDRVTGRLVDLASDTEYAFDATTGDWAERFELLLNGGAVSTSASPRRSLEVGQPYPNPAASAGVDLQLRTPAAGPVRVDLVDLLGRVVGTSLLWSDGGPEPHVLHVPLTGVAPGAYLLRVLHGESTEIRRLTVLR